MEEQDLNDEYAQIVLESRKRGEVAARPHGEERREFVRLIVDTSNIWIDSDTQITVGDVSPSGAALMSNHPIELGTVLKIMSSKGKEVPVKVVACEIDESPTEFLDAQYRVHCKFRSVKAGMALVVDSNKTNK